MVDTSSESYKKVNYLLRLRKQIERKMIIELLQKINTILPLHKYYYIGFGSVYFADFILFHKYLNMKNLISLEKDKTKKRRFEFNKPYKFIQLKMKSSTEYMRNGMNWSRPLLIWYDYDFTLDDDIINDIEYVVTRIKTNDIFFLTVDAEPPTDKKGMGEFIRDNKKWMGSTVTRKDIKEQFPSVIHRIITSVIKEQLTYRSDKIKFTQLMNISYKDTSKMYTIGGIFELPYGNIIKKCELKKLKFLSTNDNLYEIVCPLLTPKEKYCIDSCIMKTKIDDKKWKKTGLSDEEIQNYRDFYKYYPQFFESIY